MKTKKLTIALAITGGMIAGWIFTLATITSAAPSLAKKLAGKFLLQVEEKGELWYVDPVTFTRSQIRSPQECFDLVKQKMMGINNANLNSISYDTGIMTLDRVNDERFYYKGTTTVSGKYFKEFITDNLCFELNSKTNNFIPAEDPNFARNWFCFRNQSTAKSLLGVSQERFAPSNDLASENFGFGQATISISNFIIDKRATETFDSAEIIQVLSNKTNPIVYNFFNTSQIQCENVKGFPRVIPPTKAVATAAITELLKGPLPGILEEDTSTAIPTGTKLLGLEIKNQTAYADFSKELQNYGGGSCTVSAITAQIEQTLKQFQTVKNVVISVEGETEGILQP